MLRSGSSMLCGASCTGSTSGRPLLAPVPPGQPAAHCARRAWAACGCALASSAAASRRLAPPAAAAGPRSGGERGGRAAAAPPPRTAEVARLSAWGGGGGGPGEDDFGEDDNIIFLGSEDDDDDEAETSSASSSGGGNLAGGEGGGGDFAAAMAAARQQALSGSWDSEEGGWSDAEDEGNRATLQRPAEDFWTTDKERVFLVGVAYKQLQHQQAQSGRRREPPALFGQQRGGGATAAGPPRLGGLGMAAGAADAAAGAGGGGGGGGRQPAVAYSVHESIQELGRLAETAGLQVVGSSYQALEAPNNATYIGSGKVAEVARAVDALKVDTVIFDDELSPGQLRNLEKAFSGGRDGANVAVADRTALILDIFSQRARTREGKLQVELAQTEYQLPRLTRMWTHLDRVGGGGQVKGAGEKQIEIDKRLLRDRAAALRRELQAVRTHRAAYRARRSDAPIPVVALVGYTNAGKSTLLNTLTAAGVLAEDKLFATLDPTTRKVRLDGNLEVLFSDTVGFIQKLPTQLVAAFRATLEEIAAASVVLHVLDVSAPNAAAQCAAVLQVLEDLGVQELPLVTAWNKVDACPDPAAVRALAARTPDTVAISGATGEGTQGLLGAIASKLAESMVEVEVLLPYSAGALLDEVHKMGKVSSTAYEEGGARVCARVPRALAGRLRLYGAEGGAEGGAEDRSGAGAGGGGGESTWDMDDGRLDSGDLDDGVGLPYDFEVDNASLEGLEAGEAWGAESPSPAPAGGGGGGRAGRRRRQRERAGAGSLGRHQLPAELQELIAAGGGGGAVQSAVAP